MCGQSRLASLRWWFESQHKAPDDSVSFGLGCVIFPLSDSQPLPASYSLLRPLTSSSAVEGISPQKSILHSSSSSSSELLCKSSRSAPTVLGSASLLWLALASPAGCNDRLQTTLTPWTHHWTLCVCVWILSVYRGLERSTDDLNLSESRLNTPWHTHTVSGAPVINAWHWLHSEGTLTHTRHFMHALCVCVCHVPVKLHVPPFSMPCCHFGRTRNSIVFPPRCLWEVGERGFHTEPVP